MGLSRWIAIACAVAAAATGGYSGYSQLENGKLRTQLEAASLTIGVQQKAVDDAKAAIERIASDLKRQEEIAVKAQAAERKRAADLKTALKRIHNAPKSDDGPVAPVLRRELDDLRLNSVRPDGNSNAPTNPVDQNPIGADDGSG